MIPHGWRYTAAKELADVDADIRDIQVVNGHKILELAQKYVSGADQTEEKPRNAQ